MPMTPWHVGPGLAFKALGGRHISLAAFTVAQGLMDIEVIVRLLTRQEWVHGPTHTLVGSVGVAAMATVMTTPAARGLARIFRASSIRDTAAAAWRPAACGAIVGTVSHVLLDAIMHNDVYPFWPLGRWNPLLDVLDNVALHDLCFWSGAVGGIAWATLAGFRRLRPERSAATAAS